MMTSISPDIRTERGLVLRRHPISDLLLPQKPEGACFPLAWSGAPLTPWFHGFWHLFLVLARVWTPSSPRLSACSSLALLVASVGSSCGSRSLLILGVIPWISKRLSLKCPHTCMLCPIAMEAVWSSAEKKKRRETLSIGISSGDVSGKFLAVFHPWLDCRLPWVVFEQREGERPGAGTSKGFKEVSEQ